MRELQERQRRQQTALLTLRDKQNIFQKVAKFSWIFTKEFCQIRVQNVLGFAQLHTHALSCQEYNTIEAEITVVNEKPSGVSKTNMMSQMTRKLTKLKKVNLLCFLHIILLYHKTYDVIAN